jgi:hypothetical protein
MLGKNWRNICAEADIPVILPIGVATPPMAFFCSYSLAIVSGGKRTVVTPSYKDYSQSHEYKGAAEANTQMYYLSSA